MGLNRLSLHKIVAFAVLMSLLAPDVTAKGKSPWDEHIEQGRSYLQSGDWESAERALKQAMEDTRTFKDADPRLGSTYYEMGQLNVRLQNYTLAKEYYERALAVQQKLLGAESLESAASLYGVAMCKQQMGDHLGAEIFLKRVDEIWRKKLGPRDPKLISILPSMATYASMKNDFAQAENLYRQLVEIAEQNPGKQEQLGSYLNLLATTLGNEGKFSEAKDYANRAVDILKKSSDSSIAIDSAQDNLMIIRSKLPDAPANSESQRIASNSSQNKPEFDSAKKALEEKLRIAEEKVRQAEAARLAAEKAKAAEEAKLTLEKQRAAEESRIAQEKARAAAEAKLADEKAKAQEAAKLAEEKARAAEKARIAAEDRAGAAERARLAAAKEAQEAKLAAAKQLEESKIASADTKQQGSGTASKQDKALEDPSKPWHTDRAIKKPSTDKSPQWGKVRYLAEGRLISAEEYKALLLANEAYEAMRQEKYRMAADILTKALEVCPELPSAHTNLGLALARLGKSDEAIEHLKLAISLDPSRSAPWVNLASSFQASGRLKDCVETYNEYLRRFPTDKLAAKAGDLVKHLQEELTEQESVEHSVANASAAADYLPFTTVNGTIKWTDEKLPVKVYIANGSRVPGYKTEYQGIMDDAFKSWSAASGGKLNFTFVNKPEQADIDCLWTNDYSKVNSPSEGGEAQVAWSNKGIDHVKIVILTCDPTPDSPLTQNQIQAVCLHEIGHAIGLIGHSPRPEDIMFCSMPSADCKIALSSRDIGTLKHLYAPDVQIALKQTSKAAPTDKSAIAGMGVELLSSHSYAQAIEKFEAVLRIDPNDDNAKENLSKAYNDYALELASKGKETDAESVLQKALKLQNSIKNAAMKFATLKNYAQILRKLRRESEAERIEAEAKNLKLKQAN